MKSYDTDKLSKFEVALVIGSRIPCSSEVIADLQRAASHAVQIGHVPNNNVMGRNPMTDWIVENIQGQGYDVNTMTSCRVNL